MANVRRDLTTGGIAGHLGRLATPASLEMLLFSGIGLVEVYWLGKVGGDAMAGAALATTLRLVLVTPLMGLSVGGVALVARSLGARDQALADAAVMQSMLLLLAMTTVIGAVGLLFGKTFLSWMGATGELLDASWAYLQVILLGLFFMEGVPTINGVMQGAGHPEYMLRIRVLTLAVVAVADPILALGWGPIRGMGARGAAIGSVVACIAGTAAQWWLLRSGAAGVRVHRHDLAPDGALIRRILRVGMPISLQRLSPNLANALVLRLITAQGDAVLTAYSAVSQVFNFMLAPAYGLGTAAAALVGQNLGAGKPKRARDAGWWALGLALAIGLLLNGLLAANARLVLPWLVDSGELVALGTVIAAYFVVRGGAMSVNSAAVSTLGGAGDTVVNMVVNMVTQWAVQLPLCWLLAVPLAMGANGIWLGMAISSTLGALAIVLWFASGRWQKAKV